MSKTSRQEFPSIDGIYILSLIGIGNFSRVYKGVLMKEKENVAVKLIDKNNLTQGKVETIISEIGIMKSLDHPNIVRMKDFKWDSKCVYIILEYCEGGNLHEYIRLKNRLKENVCKRALQQLALGLAYLRSKNICHMDLKPQNILIKYNPFTIKIADFGLAQYISGESYKDNLRGTPMYMAPEILLSDSYNYKVDLWSVGVILYICIFGRPPLPHKNWDELLESISRQIPIKFRSTVPLSKDCKDLMEKLLVYNPDERISYDDFFSHPFIDLAHAPSEENKKLALKIINEAVLLDEKREYVKAFNAYCRALRYLIPLLETMTGTEERAYFQVKISEYLSRAEELKSVLFRDTKLKTGVKQCFTSNDENDINEVEKMLPKGEEETFVSSEKSVDTDASVCGSSAPSKNTSATDSPRKGSQNDVQEKKSDNEKAFSDDFYSFQNMKDAFATSPRIHSALDIGFTGQLYMMQGDYEIAYSKYETSLSILISEVKEFPPGAKRDFLLLQIKKWLAAAEGAKILASAKSVDLNESLKSGIEVMDNNCSIQ